MKRIISLLVVCILLTACGNKYQTIDANKAMELINNNDTVVIDVRENDEYETGHISGAINIPLANIETINYDKDTKIILYCATGVRSLEATKNLSSMGYTNLYNLDGGILNWGFELEE